MNTVILDLPTGARAKQEENTEGEQKKVGDEGGSRGKRELSTGSPTRDAKPQMVEPC